jgi:hypothetical protein
MRSQQHVGMLGLHSERRDHAVARLRDLLPAKMVEHATGHEHEDTVFISKLGGVLMGLQPKKAGLHEQRQTITTTTV